MHTIADPTANETEPGAAIRTTLYDLIEAISAEVSPDEDHLVVATMMHLLESGKIRFLGNSG